MDGYTTQYERKNYELAFDDLFTFLRIFHKPICYHQQVVFLKEVFRQKFCFLFLEKRLYKTPYSLLDPSLFSRIVQGKGIDFDRILPSN